ncbi:hypothetical protein BH23ACT3_BH23ACT3_20170 [soil metagenome]
MPPDERFNAAADLLRALGHPTRLQIAAELGDHERCVHELVELLELAQPNVSQPLKVLRAAGVVSGRRVGREVRYTLTDHHIAHIAGDALVHAGEQHDPGPAATTAADHEPIPQTPHTDHSVHPRERTPI